MTKGTSLLERTMTSAEKRKDTMLKKKYDDSDMKKNMQAQYGKEAVSYTHLTLPTILLV